MITNAAPNHETNEPSAGRNQSRAREKFGYIVFVSEGIINISTPRIGRRPTAATNHAASARAAGLDVLKRTKAATAPVLMSET
eukprot:COSAG02_NODE_3211_length_7164_cov_5.234820_6_plen_83_part_00